MKKNRKEAEEPTSWPGWATFQEVSEDFEPDNWDELEKDSFYKAPKMIRFRWHVMEKLANYWFKKLRKVSRAAFMISALVILAYSFKLNGSLQEHNTC